MFTFKGIQSCDMGLFLPHDHRHTSTSRDVNHVVIPGRDGVITLDNERYSTVEENVPIILIPQGNRTINEHITDISNWLLTDVEKHDFEWGDDPNFVYRAMCYSGYNLTNTLGRFGRGAVTFRFHPIKYLRASLETVSINSGAVINNPFNISAKPRIILRGSGNMTLNIGSSQLILQGVQDGIIVDSETQTVTNLAGTMPQFDRMFSYPFPVIEPGNQTITFTGAPVVEIQTRIGALI